MAFLKSIFKISSSNIEKEEQAILKYLDSCMLYLLVSLYIF